VVKNEAANPYEASTGELSYRGDPGNVYVNLSGSSSALGALSDVQKLAHEFKHGEQFLDGQLGFVKNLKGQWQGFKDDLVDEAEAFIAGFEAEALDPAQTANPFLNGINRAMPYGTSAVVEALKRPGHYQRGYPDRQIPITTSDLKDPNVYAIPRDKQ
jgi:hypothetical protein